MTSPFDEALQDLRISGSVLLHESYKAPWSIHIPNEVDLRLLAGVDDNVRVLPFHLVREGGFELAVSGLSSLKIQAGELAVCPGGDEHFMFEGKGAKPVALQQVLEAGYGDQAYKPVGDTVLICGMFLMQSSPLNPLLAALPPVLKVRTLGAEADPLLKHATEMLSIEVSRSKQGGFTTSRVLEVFCAEAVRAYQKQNTTHEPSWFKGLNDPKIAEVLSSVHRDPGEEWSVARLASEIAMSPSRLNARFRETTGYSVMAYVAHWRMNVACRMLRESNDGLGAIALATGYQDVAAFSRAFKKLVGYSPAHWRAEHKVF